MNIQSKQKYQIIIPQTIVFNKKREKYLKQITSKTEGRDF